ncbi:MAG: DUF6326 family protein [Deinococcota bacterium]
MTSETSDQIKHSIKVLETKALLASLWLFVLMNIIFRDIHEFLRPDFLAEVMTGSIKGQPLTEELLLLGGVMAQIPISMVVLVWVLPPHANRWANLLATLFMVTITLIFGPGDLDDTFHAAVELLALMGIGYLAWRWPGQTQARRGQLQRERQFQHAHNLNR